MVALSVVICSKSAKIIFARQFVKMTRIELEEHIVQFSRNIDSYKEITHFESDKVRFIFIPIDSYFLILITSKNSNIIEDTEILKLIYRLIQDLCNAQINYDSIIENAFEIMLGIDDIASLGYRNGINILQVKQFLQMESLEEKEFKRKKLEQERRVQKELYEKSKEFDRMRKEKKFMNDAISSSNFIYKDEPEVKMGSLKISNKKSVSNEDVEKEFNEPELNVKKDISEDKDINKGKKISKGLKLSKKKNFAA